MSGFSEELAAYDYELPPERIAQHPPALRRDARLLVWRPGGSLLHRRIQDLDGLLRPRDLLVLNDTRVFPARLLGRKASGSAAVEILLVRPVAQDPLRWEAMVRPGRRLPPGTAVLLGEGVEVVVGADLGSARREIRFPAGADPLELARRRGHVPLPPYIRREDGEEDRERYQTVFARVDGSVAAPTAGLHLDEELLGRLAGRGVERAWITLHVGPGTFRPVEEEDLRRGELHGERYEVGEETAGALRRVRGEGGRIVAVGTTVCRVLESLDPLHPRAQSGETRLFLRPPHRFGLVDVLVTNFHLPRSSLLMLVAAFAGPRWRSAYETAIAEGYRFYSYGDANWIEGDR